MSQEPYQIPLPPPPPSGATSEPWVASTNTPNTMKCISHENIFTSAEGQARKAYQWFIRDKRLTGDEVDDFVFISNYKPVKPVIQNGPLCGMVALAMASELTQEKVVSTEDIYDEAKRCGFSLQGEMFSALYMQRLASQFLDCDVKLVTLTSNEQLSGKGASWIVVKALLEDNLLLFPYDADKNHGPCQAKGHKAHWALVTGFFTAIKRDTVESHSLNCLRQDDEVKGLYYWDGGGTVDSDNKFVDILSKSADFKIYTHQGKSKYCGTWYLKDMLESNSNLLEVGPDRNSEEYVIPEGGVEEGLRCKALLVCPGNS